MIFRQRGREPIKFNDTSNNVAKFRQMLYENKISFSYNGRHYDFKSIQHLQNTINKILRDEFNKSKSAS